MLRNRRPGSEENSIVVQIRTERDKNGGTSDQNGASRSPVRMERVLGSHLL
jgi:hypothetical protein